MLFLSLSIVLSASLVLLFKWFQKFQLDTIQILVANYWTCVICATVYTGSFPFNAQLPQQEWFLFSFFMGLFFIAGFYCAAMTVAIAGVAVSSVMQKMSLLIVVAYTTYVYHESMNLLKVAGLALAVVAILLSSFGSERTRTIGSKNFLVYFFPVATLVLGGAVDICIFEVQNSFPQLSGDIGFIGVLFGMAGILGILVLLVRYQFSKRGLHGKSWLAGILLGVPNFFSIITLLKSLNMGWQGSVVFPINNVGVIAFATLIAWLLLGEKLNTYKVGSIVCSIIAIVLIAMS